jgi:predicted transcriptional regulator of viral defense system
MDKWLQFFRKHKEKSLFSFSDLLVLTEEKKPSLSVQMTRLVNSGTLNRAGRGWYENPFNPPSKEEIAMVLRYPSYLSMEYALSKNGILSQRTQTFTLVTTKNPYTYSTQRGEYEYHKIKKELFFGYENEENILVGRPEKALLDLVYIRAVHSNEMSIDILSSLVDDMETDGLDPKLISKYAKSFDRKTREIVRKLEVHPKIGSS